MSPTLNDAEPKVEQTLLAPESLCAPPDPVGPVIPAGECAPLVSGSVDDRADILLVDDSPAKLLALETILAELNQNLVKVTSGRDALRRLLTQDFAVILLDVSMPDLNGFETARLIRQRRRSEHTPIIFISAINRSDTHASLGYSLGAVDYIFTPLVPEILRTKVSVFVDLYRKTCEIRRQAEQLREMERREHVRALHDHQERIGAIFKQTSVGVMQMDLERRIVLANERYCQIAGRTLDELKQVTIIDLIHADDRAEEEALFERLASGQDRGYVHEKRYIHPDGSVVWVNANVLLISGLDGKPQGALNVVQDISERKRAEAELIVHRDKLESLVEERTEQLRRSERLASLGTLAAGIAHEINNPLNAILATAQFNLRFKEPSNTEEAFNTISTEVHRAAKIIKNVLTFAKWEKTPKARGDLNDVVRRAAELGKVYARAPGLTVRLDLNPLAPVSMNSTEIEQVIVNLIKNACESAEGTVTVTLRTEAAGDRARLTVCDNGPGIPTDIQTRIFDPFFTTARYRGGSGLGLSVCHGIIVDHRGTISVSSLPGQGATFEIRLPFDTRNTAT